MKKLIILMLIGLIVIIFTAKAVNDIFYHPKEMIMTTQSSDKLMDFYEYWFGKEKLNKIFIEMLQESKNEKILRIVIIESWENDKCEFIPLIEEKYNNLQKHTKGIDSIWYKLDAEYIRMLKENCSKKK